MTRGKQRTYLSFSAWIVSAQFLRTKSHNACMFVGINAYVVGLVDMVGSVHVILYHGHGHG